MKKSWLLPALAVFLVACSTDEETKPVANEDNPVDLIEPEEELADPEVNESAGTETPPEDVPSEEPNASYKPSNSNLLGHEEAEVLAEHIPMDELTAQVKVDNQNKRIILFENESGQKVYKSIFIKDNLHLKVIDLNSDNVLYEGNL
ncbi:hypothetical protein CSV71_07340 [Sporosarcina sp. P21c]|uniref:hypothetical protein n=1 Tax=unclassified Sporosarcina TaxID=2647733 RepID=UPI000C169FC6|nr:MULTISPECIES: hypothetical protein [unclassified Sporosarcina]PIC67033.1 hypothetical protein CSV78_09470 [Sporosarcina sp. P16a]PIC89756.1 hypothetical protein CSV71_07340 [Sporosarcina sp. P21c]PIC92486.1 hypothetical protein CSV70_10215 [Sporosarcina sp. P25]